MTRSGGNLTSTTTTTAGGAEGPEDVTTETHNLPLATVTLSDATVQESTSETASILVPPNELSPEDP
jgi:hypothetical protein